MPRFCRTALFLVLLFVGVFSAQAASSLTEVRAARAMLGPGVWSRIVRIENTGRHSAYPREVCALVFEVGGILWFYTDTDGTQSFSLRRGDLAAEKSDFVPLLRAIDPGFTAFAIVPEAEIEKARPLHEALANGCFIESCAALRVRLAHGEAIEQAKLLVYYFEQGGVRRGHTVLEYETPRGAFAVDPGAPDDRPRHLDRRIADDPLAVAQALRPDLEVVKARWIPTGGSYAAPLLARAAKGNGAASRSGARLMR